MMLRVDRKVDVLIRLYGEAVSQLETLIERALGSGALGSARYRQAQLTRAQQLLSDLQDEAIPEASQAVLDGYLEGVELAEAGELQGGFDGIHEEAVDVLADVLATKLNAGASYVGRQVDDIFRREGIRISALSLIEGQTPREATQALAEALRKQGLAGFQDVSGRLWRLDRYAEMVTRTTTREAASRGTANRLLEKGIDLVEISSHRHPHDECSDYEGKTFSLTGLSDEFPHLDKLPPFHPNCRHVLTPAAANLEAEQRQAGGSGSGAPPAPPQTGGGGDDGGEVARQAVDPNGIVVDLLRRVLAHIVDRHPELDRDSVDQVLDELGNAEGFRDRRVRHRLRWFVPDPTATTKWMVVVVEYTTDPPRVVTIYPQRKRAPESERL